MGVGFRGLLLFWLVTATAVAAVRPPHVPCASDVTIYSSEAGRELATRAAKAGLTVRQARPDEAPAIFAFITRVRSEVLGAERAYQRYDRADDVDHDLNEIASGYPGEFLVFADADGAIQGTGSYAWLDDGLAEIRKMYLAPSLRGRGIGSGLLDYLMARVIDGGAAAIQLNTQPEMTDAAALYQSRGFRWLRTTPQRITYRLELPKK